MSDLNNEILDELRRISRLLALQVTKEQTQKDSIAVLSDIGFRPKEIADFLGTTSNTVSVALVDIRKKTKGNNGKTRKVSKRKNDQ